MKNLKLILIVFMLLSGNAFAETDLNGLNHPIKASGPGFIDINTDENLKKRDIMHEGKEAKKIYGDIATIGATVSLPIGNSGQGHGYDYVPRLEWLKGSVVNVYFVKDEKTGFSFNSAKATFDFSDVKNIQNEAIGSKITGKKVILARLYWAGAIANKWHNAHDLQKRYFKDIENFQTIKFKTPKGLHTITATQENTKWYGSYTKDGMQFMYQASADVTDLVKASLGSSDKERTFAAGDIKSTEGDPFALKGYRDNGWSNRLFAPHYGGWALTIVYDFGDTEEGRKVKPKGVNIYDGLKILAPIHLSGGQSTRLDSTFVTFSGFYTPISGAIKSSLTVLSFGAKYEVDSEDLQFKKGNVFKSVSSTYNNQGSQFNGTITKFGKHMNKTDNGKLKKYHNQMDLDIYDISEMMSNRQTSAEAKLTAKVIRTGSATFGERENIGLVAFSTDLYEPQVCYQEELFVKGKDEDDSKFRRVAVKGQGETKAKKDDILRTKLTIKNEGNEAAEKVSVTTEINPNSMTYQENTTYINNNTNGSFTIQPSHHVNDNTGLQKKIGSNLQFFVGRGASENNGGTIDNTNKTFIQYDATLNKEYKETKYTVKFSNKSINLEYEGQLRKCVDKTYNLVIQNVKIDDFKAVNKNFKKKGNPENLYTQLAGEPFDVKIVYFDEKLNVGEEPTGPASNIDVDVKVVSTCDSDISVLDGVNTITAKFTPQKGLVELKNLIIKNPYPVLYFKLSYTDSSGKLHATCTSSDVFSVRPKEFRVYDTVANSILNTPRLIGGRPYPNIGLIATDKNDKPAKGYKNIIKTDTTKGNVVTFIPQLPATCAATVPPAVLAQLQVVFDEENGTGILQKILQGGAAIANRNFSFDEVGNVNLQVVDASYTAIDKTNNDCIVGSSTTTKDSFGRIGCNIELTPTPFTFIPQDISIDNVRIANFQGGNMTYISNQPEMASTVTFNLTARLGDTVRTTSRLYTNGCYSKQNSFTIGIAGNLPGFTDETGQAPNIADAIQRDVIYSSNAGDANTAKEANTANNNGAFTVNAAAFNQGIATASINLNFARRVNVAKNPFTVPDNIFTFTGVRDDDNVPGATYTAPLAPTSSSQFYYGIVYAPDYKGPLRGFNAKVYFGVFCNACNTTNYPIASSALLPSASNWFLNTTHNTTAQGQVNLYDSANTNSQTTITPRPNIANGIQIIRLLSASSTPVTDTIRMNASNWLIFNPANENATFNTFNVSFTGAPNWGGNTIDSEGNLLNGAGSAGNVLESNTGSLRNYTTDKTNKRSNW